VDLPGGTEIIGGGAAMNSCNYGWFGTGALALLLRRLQFTRRRVTSRTRAHRKPAWKDGGLSLADLIIVIIIIIIIIIHHLSGNKA